MSKVFLVAVIALLSASMSAQSPAALSRYRDVTLGDSLETVIHRLQVSAADVKVLHDRPAVVQELTWRARPFVSGTTVTADPLAQMVLTFHLGRLARIVATYDRERVAGLTDADLEQLLSEVYGVPLLPSTSGKIAPSPIAPSLRHAISVWADADTSVALWREGYPTRTGVTITSPATDQDLQRAIADGARLASEEAPQRERAQQAAATAALKDRDAQIRSENKAKFKP